MVSDSSGRTDQGHDANGPIVDLLRDLRTTKGLSLTTLARVSGVAASTLCRWELGRHRPRMSELENVLHALDATPEQRRQAILMLDVPRSIRRIREDDGLQTSGGRDDLFALPCTGDLLRAMRRRRGMTLVDVAGRIGVRASSVSRWESADTVPSAQLLDHLLDVLQAEPDERAVFGLRSLVLGDARDTDIAGLGDELEHLIRDLNEDNPIYGDLRFLVLEARLASVEHCHPFAHPLLARACCAHGEWLYRRGRLTESAEMTSRCMSICEQIDATSITWGKAVCLHAAALVYGQGGRSIIEAQRLLQRAASRTAGRPEVEAGIYRGIALCLSARGRTAKAREYLRRAEDAAMRTGDIELIRFAAMARAWHHYLVGEHSEALEVSRITRSAVPYYQAASALLAGLCCKALGNPAESERFLRAALNMALPRDFGFIRRVAEEGLASSEG